ncbi:glycosyltransferase family 4 protein [Haladaptatus sp. DFWS20]|uniref:glycosyltransferase family 4 protein n=1 Tax=Haladaptatus sp. DFWS20 TaxID=3403467 RepID=UPI003EBB22CD
MNESKKKLVLVTEYFHPETASTGQLLTDLAVGLQERGLDLVVYTGQPNYHSGENEKQPRRDRYEDVLVKRIRAPQLRQSSSIRRGFNWTVFTIWMFFTLLVSRSEHEREFIFVSNPPFLPIAMWLVCQIRRWDYTFIVYDLYPDLIVETDYIGENGFVDTIWSNLTVLAFEDARTVVALGPTMRDRIIGKAGDDFDESKVVIIHNWEDEEFITPRSKDENWFCEEHDLKDDFVLLYSGNIGENHDLETIVNAAEHFDNDAVTVLIIGEGDKKQAIVELAERKGLRGDTVMFLPYQDLEHLPYSLTAGDVSIVTVQEGMEGICVSSKLYTALAAGRPILVIAQSNDDEAKIVDTYYAGLQAAQGDVNSVVNAVKKWRADSNLITEQGENARTAFENRFTKDHSIDRYYRLLSDGKSIEVEAEPTRQ